LSLRAGCGSLAERTDHVTHSRPLKCTDKSQFVDNPRSKQTNDLPTDRASSSSSRRRRRRRRRRPQQQQQQQRDNRNLEASDN
jgi:hypothetical protein